MSEYAISGEELFSKSYGDGNLSEKSLKRAGKKELVEIIESNLPFLVEFYFTEAQKGKERKYLDQIYELVGSEKYFLKPLRQLLKGKKKKKMGEDIPNGLHIILLDAVEKTNQLFDQKVQQFKGGGKVSDAGEIYLEHLKESCDEQIASMLEIADCLTRKQTSSLIDIGISIDYAYKIARAFVPKKYITEYNAGMYIHRLNNVLMDVQKAGVTQEGEDDRYMNTVGINLSNIDSVKAVYELFLKGVSRKVFLAAMCGVILERRSKQMQFYTKPQKALYSTITELVLNVLEGDDVLNTTGKKAKEKKLVVTKDELKKVMKRYSSERVRDMKKHKDSTRRVIFKNLDEESYPKLLKMFKKAFSDVWDAPDEQRQNNNQQNNNNNNRQNNNNGGNNRNNNQRNNNNGNNRR